MHKVKKKIEEENVLNIICKRCKIICVNIA